MEKTPRKRLFTDEYKLGDYVGVIRSVHGWFEGSVVGKIVHIDSHFATVREDNGIEHEILHPRDIFPYAH